MNDVGHNNPPGMIDITKEVMVSINEWLKENPVIQDEGAAKDAKILIDRGKLALKDMDDERTKQVAPLNSQVKAINDLYREPKDQMQSILSEISRRMARFLAALEEARIAEAKAAAEKADAARREAEEKKRIAEEAIRSAEVGELGVDTHAAIAEAQGAISAASKADRIFARAEKAMSSVRVTGGFSRAASLRTQEILVVTDALKAVRATGATEEIKAAIVRAAKAYREEFDELPPGVEAHFERKL